jgi:hypothetical protein
VTAIASIKRRIGRYDIDAEIGHGGMATVYRARDSVLDRDIALKVLHPHLRGAPEARGRFHREAKTVARLRHPNVLDVYDFGEGDESTSEAYLAAELLTGPTLKEWVQTHARLGAEIAVALAIQIGEGLAAAHDASIVHRDVKPENVLLHERRVLKLTDFGIAHLVDAHTFTATGQVIGSPGHMAPEIVQGGEASVATDMFSFGTVLYFLLTGALPFTGKNPHQLLFRILEVEYVDPLRIEPAIGAELRAIVVSTLAKDPAERPVSMRVLLDQLHAFLRARGFDDESALAAEGLADPAAATARVRPLAVRAELALGEAAERSRDTMGALAHYDRALALEPGRADVLERVRRAGQGDRSSAFRVAGAGLAALGALALVLAFVSTMKNPPASGATNVRNDDAAQPIGARRFIVAPSAPPSSTRIPEGIVMSAQPPTSPRVAPPPAAPPPVAAARPRNLPPRMVTFRPDPQNVTISIDDGPPHEFGPSFRGAELSPGAHRVRMVAGTDCCEALAFTLDVAEGTTPLIVARHLPFRASRVYVVSSVPADVVVEVDGQVVARGRTRELLRVPMQSLESGGRIVVTAEGHHGYTSSVRLRAGEVAQATASLALATP